MLILLSGIPGCAKSALCEQILNTPGGLGDNRPLHSLMGDRTKGMERLQHFLLMFIGPNLFLDLLQTGVWMRSIVAAF